MDDFDEIMRLTNEVDLTKYFNEFNEWKQNDGSIEGLKNILNKQEGNK